MDSIFFCDHQILGFCNLYTFLVVILKLLTATHVRFEIQFKSKIQNPPFLNGRLFIICILQTDAIKESNSLVSMAERSRAGV